MKPTIEKVSAITLKVAYMEESLQFYRHVLGNWCMEVCKQGSLLCVFRTRSFQSSISRKGFQLPSGAESKQSGRFTGWAVSYIGGVGRSGLIRKESLIRRRLKSATVKSPTLPRNSIQPEFPIWCKLKSSPGGIAGAAFLAPFCIPVCGYTEYKRSRLCSLFSELSDTN
jgi:hypothetical protein